MTEAMGRVLVVDDDAQIRDVVALALLDEGYEVVTAANGAIALERAVEYPPHLILLDMRMPVLDGWRFAAAYRAQTAHPAPIVVMTAAQDARRWAAEIAAAGCLPKPFDLGHLLDLVAAHAHPNRQAA